MKMVTTAIKITGTTTIKAIAYIGKPVHGEEERTMSSRQAEGVCVHTHGRDEGDV